MATLRIGELLKQRGVLDDQQIEQILARQRLTGAPFGSVAAELFGVQEAELWRAWAQQVIDCCPRVSPLSLKPTPKALSFVTPREAWAYRILPFEWTDQELLIATTPERLPNAMAYAQIKSPVPAVFSLADRVELEEAIRQAYKLKDLQKAA
ncbi:MAG: hypothetical protein ACK4PI_02420 [Tepidisphaerales bacterium]